MEHHPVKYIQCMCSPAHTYGNATAFMQKWLLDHFPKRDNGESIFRTINVSSNIAHRQIRRTPKEINKNLKPMLMIRPRVDFTEDRFLQGTPITERMLLRQTAFAPEVLQPFFLDKSKKVSMQYQLNRTVMYFDITMIFGTYMQQLNYANYYKNAFPIEKPFDLDTFFESYLAVELLEMVSEISGIPIADERGSVKKFLAYMNQHSNAPVTYKLQGSTNSREFYRYYPAKIITTMSQVDVDEGEKTNMIADSYQMHFSIKTEFYTTGFYYLFSDQVFKVKRPIIPDDSSIIPVFTDVLLREDWDMGEGWTQYNRASYRLSKEHDEVDISSMLSPSIEAAIDYYLHHDYYIKEIIDIRVREQGRIMNEGDPNSGEYHIDYPKRMLCFHNKEFGYFTYTIMICINIETINALVQKIYNLP